MLTATQPSVYGYKSVHDLPTPPSATRLSPPSSYQEAHYGQSWSVRRSQSPITQPMSNPHRGLPPPAAMALPPQQQQQQQQQPPPQPQQQPPQQQQQQQQSHSSGNHPHSHHHHHQHQVSQPPPPTPQNHQTNLQGWTQLPAPPPQWQGAEESMRNWLQTRAEEEKTKQEEEKTKQETLRLEQRKIELDMLRSSFGGGIPPPMVPLVFAGMGGGNVLPQAALEWAQQFLPSSSNNQLQLMGGQNTVSAQREPVNQGYGSSSTQGSNPGPGAYTPHPGSPNRTRAQSNASNLGSSMSQGGNHPNMNHPNMNHPSLNTNIHVGGGVGPPPHQAHSQMQTQQAQQDPSPSIYFHHWQPPTSQAGSGANRPGSPSGESARKRKAAGEQRSRSPPPFTSSSSSNHPTAGRKGHKRQRSDVSWYRPSSAAQDRADESDRSARDKSPAQPTRERSRSEVGKHSVSSLLSTDPVESSSVPQQGPGEGHLQPWQPGGPSRYPEREAREPRQSPPHESDPHQGGGSR